MSRLLYSLLLASSLIPSIAKSETIKLPAVATSTTNVFSAPQIFSGGISMTGTGLSSPEVSFYQQNGAIVHRLGDRLFVGGAIPNDARFPNVSQNWLQQYQNSLVATGQSTAGTVSPSTGMLDVLTSTGNNGGAGGASGVFGTRDTYMTSVFSTPIGVQAFAVANNATIADNVYAAYFEADRTLGAAANQVLGLEIDTSNHSSSAELTPTPWQQAATTNLQLASGSGLSATNPTPMVNVGDSLEVVPNPTAFKAGIVFNHLALEGTDGTSGFGKAVILAPFQGYVWENSSGGVVGGINNTNTTTTNAPAMTFVAGGINFTGTMEFGTYTGTTCTNAGSIGIQDSGGTVRKIMICS